MFNFRTFAMSSPFGMRQHPVDGKRKMHNGVDFRAAPGTPITADAVLRLERKASQADGNAAGHRAYYRVETGPYRGWLVAFFHLQSLPAAAVGTFMQPGSTLGLVGSTGKSTGPHIHMEAWDKSGARKDPTLMLRHSRIPSAIQRVASRVTAAVRRPAEQVRTVPSVVRKVTSAIGTESIAIARGDTVWELLQRRYPSEGAAKIAGRLARVKAANPGIDLNRVRAGQIIRLPRR